MTLTFAAGCAHAPSGTTPERPVPIENRPLAIRFDNGAREYVHVYLIGEKRQWLLGRVEPGAIATLRIPEASLVGTSRSVQLVVLTGEHANLQAARDSRASFTIVQPTASIVSQQWSFSDGHISSVRLPRVDVR